MKRKVFAGADEFAALYRSGLTLKQIGDRYGVTRERIRQLLTRAGVGRTDGGAFVSANNRALLEAVKKKETKAARQEYWEKELGCSFDIIKSLSFGRWPAGERQERTGSPVCRYLQQKHNAKNRGIDWNLSLTDWWRAWQESGKWDQRGRGKGYVMARYGDSGPYELGNIYICTHGQNSRDSYITKPWAQRFPDLRGA